MTWQPRPELNHLYPDQLRERAEADDLAVHPPAPAATEATGTQEQP